METLTTKIQTYWKQQTMEQNFIKRCNRFARAETVDPGHTALAWAEDVNGIVFVDSNFVGGTDIMRCRMYESENTVQLKCTRFDDVDIAFATKACLHITSIKYLERVSRTVGFRRRKTEEWMAVQPDKFMSRKIYIRPIDLATDLTRYPLFKKYILTHLAEVDVSGYDPNIFRDDASKTSSEDSSKQRSDVATKGSDIVSNTDSVTDIVADENGSVQNESSSRKLGEGTDKDGLPIPSEGSGKTEDDSVLSSEGSGSGSARGKSVKSVNSGTGEISSQPSSQSLSTQSHVSSSSSPSSSPSLTPGTIKSDQLQTNGVTPSAEEKDASAQSKSTSSSRDKNRGMNSLMEQSLVMSVGTDFGKSSSADGVKRFSCSVPIRTWMAAFPKMAAPFMSSPDIFQYTDELDTEEEQRQTAQAKARETSNTEEKKGGSTSLSTPTSTDAVNSDSGPINGLPIPDVSGDGVSVSSTRAQGQTAGQRGSHGVSKLFTKALGVFKAKGTKDDGISRPPTTRSTTGLDRLRKSVATVRSDRHSWRLSQQNPQRTSASLNSGDNGGSRNKAPSATTGDIALVEEGVGVGAGGQSSAFIEIEAQLQASTNASADANDASTRLFASSASLLASSSTTKPGLTHGGLMSDTMDNIRSVKKSVKKVLSEKVRNDTRAYDM